MKPSEWLLIGVARALLPVIQSLPMTRVAALGRAGGRLAWHLDRRHRRVALDNLAHAYPDLPPAERTALARENFLRLGENYACGARAATLSWEEIQPHLEFGPLHHLTNTLAAHPDRSVILALGHFGNFELLTWARLAAPGIPIATTYRALRQETATRLLLDLRRRSGCLFFERRRDARALRETLRSQRVILGLLADQHDGRGVRVPFFGRDAGTSTAPALLAQRYRCPLLTAFCFRTAPARWRIEVGPPIATHHPADNRRPLADIARDMNRAFEAAVRRDPANWFWVHRRWKPGPATSYPPGALGDGARAGAFDLACAPMIPRPPSRLLVRGVNWLGDAVMTTPALWRLRELSPDMEITILSPAKLSSLWPAHPAVDHVIPFGSRLSPFAVARLLRGTAFDAALILPNSPRSALELWLARIPVRIGHARAWRSWMLTTAVPDRPDRVAMTKPSPAQVRDRLQYPVPVDQRRPPWSAHHLHDYLHLAAALGASPAPLAPVLVVTDAEVDAARSRFALDPATVWAGLNPGAEYGPAKRWPAERFVEAARAVSRTNPKLRWLVLGGPADVALATSIHQALPSSVLAAGRTSLRELMALSRVCRVLLTNDTGPMHVAAALGTPVVVPFGSTSPELTGPGLPGDARHHLIRLDVPCAPCFLRQCPIDFRCMLGLAPEQLANAVNAALASGTDPRRA